MAWACVCSRRWWLLPDRVQGSRSSMAIGAAVDRHGGDVPVRRTAPSLGRSRPHGPDLVFAPAGPVVPGRRGGAAPAARRRRRVRPAPQQHAAGRSRGMPPVAVAPRAAPAGWGARGFSGAAPVRVRGDVTRGARARQQVCAMRLVSSPSFVFDTNVNRCDDVRSLTLLDTLTKRGVVHG
jgi:hypothetical protein